MCLCVNVCCTVLLTPGVNPVAVIKYIYIKYVTVRRQSICILSIFTYLWFIFQGLKFEHRSLTVRANSMDTEHKQQVKVKQSRYRPGVAQWVAGS